jgi:hypothetical protein
MQKIKKFTDFVNEDYSFGKGIKKAFSKATSWVSNLINKIKGGEVPVNTKGDKVGLPMIAYFAYGDGDIKDQVDDFFAGSKYASMHESMNIKEGDLSPHLSWPGEEGPLDIGADALKEIIKKRYKSLVRVTKVKKGEEDVEVTGYSRPIFIFGAPGIGKTEIVAQAAQELGLDVIFGDVAFMEPADFLGLPSKVEVASDDPYGEGVTRGNPPLWLPRSNDGKKYKDRGGILFFDELNRANLPVTGGCMQLFQERRVQDYNLPSKWLIIAAGNRTEDDVEDAIKEMPTPFWDRVDAFNYVPTLEGFTSHVLGVDQKTGKKTPSYDYIPKGGEGKPLREIVLPELITFLQFSKEFFHSLDPNNVGVGRKYATPRGWIEASKSLYSELITVEEETGKRQISSDEVYRIFASAVGQTAANAFVNFYKIVQAFPIADVVKVFDEPEKAPVPRETSGPDEIWAMLAAIVSKSSDIGKLTPQQYSNAIDWSIRLKTSLGDLAPEYSIAFVHMLNAKHPYAIKGSEAMPYLKSIRKFSEAYLVDFEEFRTKS